MNNFSLMNAKLNLIDWYSFFENSIFITLTPLEQQVYLTIFLYNQENQPLSIAKIKGDLKKNDSTIRKIIKNLENRQIIEIQTHLSNEVNRKLQFIYLKQKLNFNDKKRNG